MGAWTRACLTAASMGVLASAGAVFSGETVEASSSPVQAASDSQQALLGQYCVRCHNQRARTGGLALDTFDLARVGEDASTWEKVVRKLRAGMMPPPGQPRPDRTTVDRFASWLETELDRSAAAAPNAGRTEAMHRLNRAEYRNVIRDLLSVEIDVASLLPADDASYGFDNMAGVLRFSPLLLEKYLVAAGRVSRIAVGIPPTAPNFDVFRVPDDLPQDDRLEGLPFGTRGGTLIRYYFPVDGEYVVRVRLARQTAGQDYDIPRYDVPQELEVSVDGEPLQVFTLAPTAPLEVGTRANYGGGGGGLQRLRTPPPGTSQPAPPASQPPAQQPRRGGGMGATRHLLDSDWQVRFSAKAGRRNLAVTWLNRTPALLETRVQPYLNPLPTGSNMWTPRKGAYVKSVEVSGPFQPTGSGDTSSRERIFVCRPMSASDEAACAKTILSALARPAFRRPVVDADIQPLLEAYRAGRAKGSFDQGIALGIQRLLVSPEFLFRFEVEPAGVEAGAPYRISDLDLASRLSFFLWSSVPDDELLDVAVRGDLRQPAVLDEQLRRMLADRRATALIDNFVGQWLFLRNVPALRPDPAKDPDFDQSLRQALQRETELFVESLIREDRSVLELLTAKYTFLNERLAKHYQIPNVQGTHFRRVTIPDDNPRAGILGHGSLLAVTSEANRTSPVKRGKWVLENLLGVPPPDPPANVPALEEDGGSVAVTMRERLAEHRQNPVCASCHSLMDPIGLALENFDQAGRWRSVDEGSDSRKSVFVPIDASGVSPDGEAFVGPAGLRQALLNRSERIVTTVVEKLLTYALGRGVEYYDAPAIRSIVREAARNDFRFSSLITGVVRSLPFQMRQAGSDVTQVASAVR